MVITILITANENLYNSNQSEQILYQTTTLTYALPYDFAEFGYFTAYSMQHNNGCLQ